MVSWDNGYILRASTPTGVYSGRVEGVAVTPGGPSVRSKGLVTEAEGRDQLWRPEVGGAGQTLGFRSGHERQGQL